MYILNESLISLIGIHNLDIQHVLAKLMRFGLPNRIDVVESKLKSEFDRRVTPIRISTIQSTRRFRIRYKIDLFSI